MRAQQIAKPNKMPLSLRRDLLFRFCFTSAQQSAFYQLCTPCVFLPGERITFTGQKVTHFIVILSGTARFVVTCKGQVEQNEVIFPIPIEENELYDKSKQRLSANRTFYKKQQYTAE
uniref:Cyclic nucleotide-binding domain-containing protein n=1 Tax=Lygus hesperus TaxID=30085 RepID=A0A146LA55_LYGHE